MEDDVTIKMLTALTTPENQKEDVSKAVMEMPLSAKIEFIQKNVNKIPIADRKEIALIIVTCGKKEFIQECAEGACVNLNALNDPNIIDKIYNVLVWKLARK